MMFENIAMIFFIRNSSIHSHITKRCNDIDFSKPSLNLGKRISELLIPCVPKKGLPFEVSASGACSNLNALTP